MYRARGYSVGEFEERLEPFALGVSEGFSIDPAVGAGDVGAELAFSGALRSRVIDACEVVYDGYGCGLRLSPFADLPQF